MILCTNAAAQTNIIKEKAETTSYREEAKGMLRHWTVNGRKIREAYVVKIFFKDSTQYVFLASSGALTLPLSVLSSEDLRYLKKHYPESFQEEKKPQQ
jgi:hypothetical protein